MVKSHVQHLSVLLWLEEGAVLVNDRFVGGLGLRLACRCWLTLYIVLFDFFEGLCPLRLDSVLHEARKHLSELNFGAFLRFVAVELLLDELLVKARVEQRNCLGLIQL